MKKFNVVVPKSYEKDGEKRTAWNTVGSLVMFPPKQGEENPGFILELNWMPETTFKVFEQKPKEERTQQPTQSNDGDPGISDADIPY